MTRRRLLQGLAAAFLAAEAMVWPFQREPPPERGFVLPETDFIVKRFQISAQEAIFMAEMGIYRKDLVLAALRGHGHNLDLA